GAADPVPRRRSGRARGSRRGGPRPASRGHRGRLPCRACAAAFAAAYLLGQAQPQSRAGAVPRRSPCGAGGRARDRRGRDAPGRGGAMTVETLVGVIRRVKPTEAAIGPETRFVDDLGFDSLTVMELVAEVEDEFDINLPINLLPEIHTVAELAGTIERLRD